ncbi:MAG TPA: MBL fold metallo-hydrolase [Macellibacteroides fermentans]|uniref:MBL fold metallo-hydrolase n=1 Tax=Macellibacteroides fermentans TaxID=879969 RepID=UPI002C610A1C|nr:MBL fold metallo-hydrolase [Macellibacteroides fermentans]
MEITTLIENLVYQSGLVAEHGLSFYMEGCHKKILFDTGQSDCFIANAKALGVDLSDVDALIVSHGHYDHTGGLEAFLKINTKAVIYMKPGAIDAKYHGKDRFIGTSIEPQLLKDRLSLVYERTEIDKGIFIMPHTPLVNANDTAMHGFQVKEGPQIKDDTFQDELFLTVERNGNLSIISSCSHRGISNMVYEAVRTFSLPVDLILGGFHLKNCTPRQYEEVVASLNEIKPTRIGVCHCTGIEKYFTLKQDLTCIVFYNMTGHRVCI